ncbi:MAG: NCS2 family permease [Candidatus Methylomirabilis oxyfera]|nr:NCS2 family permease [Candidatus Methylomirabilis oxyfera]
MRPHWFVRGDIDGFFGLFIDNLLQLMVIAVLCRSVGGLPTELITSRILPGAAVSILFGNLFYAWQARQLMRRTGRDDVTALPYGINTPSLFAYVFLIMGPIYQETRNPTLVWQAGLFACLISGLMETAGAFVGDWLRRHTPRAALLSALAGVAITFIAMGFIFQIFASPAIAVLPMMMILITYASRTKLPLGLPGGLVAVLTGVVLAWVLRAMGFPYFQPSTDPFTLALHPPVPVPGDLIALLTSATGWKYMAVIFPMGLFNVIGSLQNLESAEAAGDRYETRPSLLANGIGSLAAALFGSTFPTTIYIGHPAWKAMGARAGYSILNGAVVTLLCLLGGITLVLKVIPLEATLGILLWIGIIITAQAFQEVPKSHALAVALGLIPSLAAWALQLVEMSLRKAGKSLFEAAPTFGNDLYINGVIALNQGFLLSSMVLAAILVFVIEREFLKAAGWTAAAAVLSMIGLIHAYDLTPLGVQNKFGVLAAPGFAIMYASTAMLLVLLYFTRRSSNDAPPKVAGLDRELAHRG